MTPAGAKESACPEQRIMRIVQGQPIPSNWRFVQFLGTETDLIYAPTYKADVVLLERNPDDE